MTWVCCWGLNQVPDGRRHRAPAGVSELALGGRASHPQEELPPLGAGRRQVRPRVFLHRVRVEVWFLGEKRLQVRPSGLRVWMARGCTARAQYPEDRLWLTKALLMCRKWFSYQPQVFRAKPLSEVLPAACNIPFPFLLLFGCPCSQGSLVSSLTGIQEFAVEGPLTLAFGRSL